MVNVNKIALYNHGMAYITRKTEIKDLDTIALQFKQREMNDILKSLIVVDSGQGDIAGLSYETSEDIDKRIKNRALAVSNEGSIRDLLQNITGSVVELGLGKERCKDITDGSEIIVGRVVGLQDPIDLGGSTGENIMTQVLILLENGDIRLVPITRIQELRLEDISAYSDVRFYLDAIISKGKKNMKGVTLFLDGEDHDLDISYISQMAPWRMTYRLFHREKGTTLQCWGIVDNTLDEDLKDIDLTLVSGKPISFIYDLYLAQMVKRQLIKEEHQITTAPVELEGEKRELERDRAQLEEMRDMKKMKEMVQAEAHAKLGAVSGGALAEQMADLMMERSICADAAPPAPAMEMAKAAPAPARLMARKRKMANKMEMEFAECEEEVCYDEDESFGEGYGTIDDLIGDFEDGLDEEIIQEREATEVDDYGEAAESTVVETEGIKLPEFFLYNISSPVTIKRGQSAMVPIVQKEISCTREMVYNRLKTGKHPLIVMRMDNDLDVKLERGPITVFQGNDYAGEGILPELDPTEEVRVAFAIATGVRVREDNHSESSFREIELKGNILVYNTNHDEKFNYIIENDTLDEIGVIIEHPRSETHKLLDMEDPFEVGENFYRWKITVKPKKEVRFEVVQRNIIKDKNPILNNNIWTYKKYLEEGKINKEQFTKLEEILDMSNQVNRYQNNLNHLRGQESQMINYLHYINTLSSVLGLEPEELNLKNLLCTKYFKREYRLARLRVVILQMKKDTSYLRKALNHLYWPEKYPDFKFEKPEDIPDLKRLMAEQNLQYWYNQNSQAVGYSIRRQE